MAKYKKYKTWEEAAWALNRPKSDKKNLGAAFSKNNFDAMLYAMLNDIEFKEEVVKYSGGTASIEEVENVMITQEFRKFLKNVLTDAGMDPDDAAIVESKDFEIKSVEGLYELSASSIYQFCSLGHKFNLLPKKDFVGSIGIREYDEDEKIREVRNPQTGEKYKQRKKTGAHREICGVSHIPAYLIEKERLS